MTDSGAYPQFVWVSGWGWVGLVWVGGLDLVGKSKAVLGWGVGLRLG